MEVEFYGEILEFPDDMPDSAIEAILAQEAANRGQQNGMQETQAQDPRQITPLSVGGEFASAANRAVMGGLDFLGPGAINAGLSLAGSDYQVPTFSGGFAQTPGAAGGFMPPGTARDVTRAAGATLPTAAGLLTPVAGRDLAQPGGALAEMLGFGTARQPFTPLATGSTPEMVSRADDIGWPLTPGDRLDNRAMKNLEASIQSTSMPANPMSRVMDRRQELMNQAAARAVGLPADESVRLTPDVVGDVADELGNEFRSLKNMQDLPVDEQFLDSMINTQTTARSRLFTDPDLSATVDKIFDKVDDLGGLKASDYQDLSSELKAKIRQAWKTPSPDPYYADSLGELVDALDELAENGMSGEALSALKRARGRWRALQALENSRSIHESGNVSGPLLANYLRRTDKGGYLRGKNSSELYETARLSKAFPQRPDSGTASRLQLQNILQAPWSFALGMGLSPFANAYMAGVPAATKAAGTIGALSPYIVNPTFMGRLSEQP